MRRLAKMAIILRDQFFAASAPVSLKLVQEMSCKGMTQLYSQQLKFPSLETTSFRRKCIGTNLSQRQTV